MSWRINSHAVQRPARDNDGVLDRRATHVVLSTLWMGLTDGMTLLASAAISMIVPICLADTACAARQASLARVRRQKDSVRLRLRAVSLVPGLRDAPHAQAVLA
jgi:hypothetical protein